MKTVIIENSIIGLLAVEADSETFLDRLEQKELYRPFIDRMSEHRKCEWLAVRFLIKEMLGEEKEIRYKKNGMPYLADCSFFISISHTKGFVAVILNREHEVAIDIEKISPRVLNVAQRFMNEDETTGAPSSDDIIYLLLHWSAKEAVFKRLHDEAGLDFRKDVKITPFRPVGGEWGIFEAAETKTAGQQVFTVHYLVTENIVLTAIV
jgi:4'-phosphopantetheinyl transferase EntD